MPKQPKTTDASNQEGLPQGYDAQRAKLIGADPLVGIDPITGQPQRSVSKELPAAPVPASSPRQPESSNSGQVPDEEHAGMRR